MKIYQIIIYCVVCIASSFCAYADEKNSDIDKEDNAEASDVKGTRKEAAEAAAQEDGTALNKFGFGPALYVIRYDDEVLADSNNVSVKGDGTISANGTDYSTSMGFELHYDFSFAVKRKCIGSNEHCKNVANYTLTTAHRFSPFLGFYDVDNGINGIAAGIVYGYIKKHDSDKNPVTLNAGLGWTVHKDRLVLSRGLAEGATPASALKVEDYTERKDVTGTVLMISVNMGF